MNILAAESLSTCQGGWHGLVNTTFHLHTYLSRGEASVRCILYLSILYIYILMIYTKSIRVLYGRKQCKAPSAVCLQYKVVKFYNVVDVVAVAYLRIHSPCRCTFEHNQNANIFIFEFMYLNNKYLMHRISLCSPRPRNAGRKKHSAK